MQWYFREIDSENMYTKNVKNEEIVHLFFYRSHGVFITHESCHFVERKDWSVISPLWYFELYYTQNNTYWIDIKYRGTRTWFRKKIYGECWAWVRCPSPLEVKLDPGVLLEPKHTELGCDSSSPRGPGGACPVNWMGIHALSECPVHYIAPMHGARARATYPSPCSWCVGLSYHARANVSWIFFSLFF